MKHIIALLTGILILHFTSTAQILPLSWELGYKQPHQPAEIKWIEARVPGAVQLDIAAAEKYEPWYYAENWRNFLWMEDNSYTYRARFNRPPMKEDDRCFFYSAGIDYAFAIRLNGKQVFTQEGMFTPVKTDLTEWLLDENVLEIFIQPVPKSQPEPASRVQANQVVKPAVSYGWDWHPRVVPLGIWDVTGLIIEPSAYAEPLHVSYQLNPQLTRADFFLTGSGRNLAGCKARWTLKNPGGTTVFSKDTLLESEAFALEAFLNRPVLWWPHDQGTPALYTWTFELYSPQGRLLQSTTSKVGLRRVKLVMSVATLNDPSGFPKSRRLPPAQLEINNRRIFCKGTNWVNPEVFPGIITGERYNELIDRAIEANFNTFRIWGGGIVNKDTFYSLCDEKGMLVWQEFPLACNAYPDDPHYLKILEQESSSIVTRLRNHPSVVLWCGGNELFNSWSGMDDQSLALRLLNSQCLRLDPNTPFIPTSPLEGMAHGHYVFRDFQTGEEVFARMNRAVNTAYTEFGMPSPASVGILKTIIPPGELWPPAPGGSWESHHGFNAWVGNTWLAQEMIEDYFGKSQDIEQLVANGQALQGVGYKYIYETARRQKPFCSMALNWCYNEPWPTAANNSLVSYPNIPKPAFYEVQSACRPVLASATIEKFTWKPGEEFFTRLWMLNDSPARLEPGEMTASLVMGSNQVVLGTWAYSTVKPNENLKGNEYSVTIPDWPPGTFKLVLEVSGKPGWRSEYLLIIKK